MKKFTTSALFVLLILLSVSPFPAFAHRSGCHRWHSCESDTGSYVCGDLGYTSGCPTATTPSTQITSPVSTTFVSPIQLGTFVGTPKIKADLYRCAIVGNFNSHIYHLKGSKYIRSMSVKKKVCFTTESEAVAAGFRKAKAK